MSRSSPCPGRQLARGRSTPICLIPPVYNQIAARRDPVASTKAPGVEVPFRSRAVEMFKEGQHITNQVRLFELVSLYAVFEQVEYLNSFLLKLFIIVLGN